MTRTKTKTIATTIRTYDNRNDNRDNNDNNDNRNDNRNDNDIVGDDGNDKKDHDVRIRYTRYQVYSNDDKRARTVSATTRTTVNKDG